MYINTNVSALNTISKLSTASNDSARTMEGLASGKRINRASDDAAGTAVASRMTTQVKGLAQASRNASDGIAALQTFEGAMGSQVDILQRMRELAVQSANGTYSDDDRTNLDAEFTQLKEELTRISEKTSFNGNKFLDPSAANKDLVLQVSDVAGDVLTVTFAGTDVAGGVTVGVDSAANAQTAIANIDAVLDTVNAERANLGGYMNRLEYTVENLSNSKVNLSDAKSRIEDLDMAEAMSELTKNEILTQSSIAMLGKANQAPQQILSLLR